MSRAAKDHNRQQCTEIQQTGLLYIRLEMHKIYLTKHVKIDPQHKKLLKKQQ